MNPGEGVLYRGIRLEALADSPAAFGTTLEQALSRSDESWAAQADASASGDDRATFVVMDEAPAGLGAIYRDEIRADEGELLQMWIAPALRGTGAGASLLDALFAWATSVGIKMLRAEVAAGNPRAHRFYERHGFVIAGSGNDGGSNGKSLLSRRLGGDFPGPLKPGLPVTPGAGIPQAASPAPGESALAPGGLGGEGGPCQ